MNQKNTENTKISIFPLLHNLQAVFLLANATFLKNELAG